MARKQQKWTRKKLHRERIKREEEAKETARIGKAINRRHTRTLRKIDQVLSADDTVEFDGPSPSYPLTKKPRYRRG